MHPNQAVWQNDVELDKFIGMSGGDKEAFLAVLTFPLAWREKK